MSILLIFVLFLTVICLFSLLRPDDFRENILKAFLVTFFMIGLSTEILSLFNSITFSWIQRIWYIAVFTSLLSVVAIWIRKKTKSAGQSQRNNIGSKSLPKGTVFFFSLIILLITSITIYIALKSPPNNFDSMTYHMARIPHWIQNQNIRYYPTAIPRQNYSMPLAEYAVLHLQVLSKSDHYANLIQWFSFILSIATASLIGRQLKISIRGQVIIAVLVATLPMAILQSSSTQNDLVVGLFCLSFSYFLLEIIEKASWENIVFAGLSMGMALATKGTAYIFCAAIGLGIGSFALIRTKWTGFKDLLPKFILIIALALVLNTGIYLRNWNLYHHPIITSNERTMVEEMSPGIFMANILRNSAIHLTTPLSAINERIEKGVVKLLGPQINNPESTFEGSKFDISFSINEDDANNAMHFLLLPLCIIALPFIKTENESMPGQYLLVIILSFFFFNLAFKWQPWGGRLLTPFFMMGCVFIGYVIDRLIRQELTLRVLFIILFLTSTPYLLFNANRPLLPIWEDDSVFYDTPLERKLLTGINNKLEKYPVLSENLNSAFSILYEGRSVILTERRELYFLGNFDPYYWNYVAGLHYVRNDPALNIGLLMDNNQWEYPIWVLLNQHASSGPLNLYHIEVEDISRIIPSVSDPRPDLILVTRADYQDLDIISAYQEVYTSPSFKIFKFVE